MYEVDNEAVFVDALTAAIVRSANRAWQSDYVRASFPKHSAWTYFFFTSIINLLVVNPNPNPFDGNVLKEFCRADELVPGMSAKQLLRIIMKDDRIFPQLDKRRRSRLLEEIYYYGAEYEDKKEFPWSHLTAEDRIELLDMSHDWDAPNHECVVQPAEFFTSIKTCVRHMITGCQTKTLLKMYQLCQTMSPPPDMRTTQMIKKIRNAMIVQYLPKVAIYGEIVEPRAREQGIDQPLPEVLNSIIAEFSFEPKYVWASIFPSRKGLQFLTDDSPVLFTTQTLERDIIV
jgi:hypothetical protein